MSVTVTDLEGRTLPDVWVKASGPVDREAPTDAQGTVTFRNMAGGSYRLRFEHDQFVTLERDVTVQAGRTFAASVALNAAPPPPPPPQNPVPPPQPVLPSAGPPTSISIVDFLDKNLITNQPSVMSPMGCAPSATANLLQLRDPFGRHAHADADELLYVVAGEGTHNAGGRDFQLKAGVFAVVPRGTAHSLTRRGGRPLIVLSIMSGQPCQSK